MRQCTRRDRWPRRAAIHHAPANRELAAGFNPPGSTSRAGAAVAARRRRDGYDWRRTIADLTVPTLVIHGAEDLLSVVIARELAAPLPTSRLAVLPGAGHMPPWEAPEEFFALVEQFLAEP